MAVEVEEDKHGDIVRGYWCSGGRLESSKPGSVCLPVGCILDIATRPEVCGPSSCSGALRSSASKGRSSNESNKYWRECGSARMCEVSV